MVSICFGLFNLLKDNENQITEAIYKAGYPKIKFELGPAKEIMAASLRGFFRL